MNVRTPRKPDTCLFSRILHSTPYVRMGRAWTPWRIARSPWYDAVRAYARTKKNVSLFEMLRDPRSAHFKKGNGAKLDSHADRRKVERLPQQPPTKEDDDVDDDDDDEDKDEALDCCQCRELRPQ